MKTIEDQVASQDSGAMQLRHKEMQDFARQKALDGITEENTVHLIRAASYRVDSSADWEDDKLMATAIVSEAFREVKKERRADQREASRAIGEGRDSPTLLIAEQINLPEAVERFVFVTDGKIVVDLQNSTFAMTFHEFDARYAASKHPYINGEGKPKIKTVGAVWIETPNRMTVDTITFKPGAAIQTAAPSGALAINTWRPREREMPKNFEAQAELFVSHVRWLFGEYSDIFLDWLAHIEQKPGELPHFGWIHIARAHGIGRNWVASVLVRLWRGNVAASFDLIGTLNSGFNDRLGRCLLAIVDEIHEGGDLSWKHANVLRQLITAEYRNINPKYGRQRVEFNCTRFLLFSNHAGALPLDEKDRRFWIVECKEAPKPAAYYAELYALLNQPDFIQSIGYFLKRRDISNFQPGQRPPMTGAKAALVALSKSEVDLLAEDIAARWPVDVIYFDTFESLLSASTNSGFRWGRQPSPKAIIYALDRVGIRRASRAQIRVDGGRQIPYVIRNHDRWIEAGPEAIRSHIDSVTDEVKKVALWGEELSDINSSKFANLGGR